MTKYGERWRESSDVVTMFPTLVWKVELQADFHETLDTEILAVLTRMRMGLPAVATGQAWNRSNGCTNSKNSVDWRNASAS